MVAKLGVRCLDRPLLALDRRDAYRVLALEVAAALEQLERVFFVGQTNGLDLLQTEQRDVARCAAFQLK